MGEAPPVPIAATTAPRSMTAGVVKSQSLGLGEGVVVRRYERQDRPGVGLGRGGGRSVDPHEPGRRALEQPRLGLRRLPASGDHDDAAGQREEGGEGVHAASGYFSVFR
jgi:hypothetical protein